ARAADTGGRRDRPTHVGHGRPEPRSRRGARGHDPGRPGDPAGAHLDRTEPLLDPRLRRGGVRAAEAPPGTVRSRPTALPWPTAASPAPTSCAERVFAHLSEPQRVGQLFIVGLANDRFGTDAANGVRNDHFGSVTFIQTTSIGATGVRDVAESVQRAATSSAT